jgi:hypothetical protein
VSRRCWLSAGHAAQLGYIDASTKPIALQEGGREDRNDPKDQEIMAHYDLQDFRDVRIQTA